ncbi:DUF948 domain-containing protein [Rossellomorea sp. AcN35-11]|nr:DUF948 domain-containing protein [Rossellomorea aquimaris]WJV28518.1 DUF948 domain-containing protein [Rossellomorea sp. AcN35-11]
MWVVYASIALMVIALVMLGTALMKTVKTTRPVINEMNQTVGRIQAGMDKMTAEANQLQETQGEIQEDIENKKTTINHAVEEAKRTPEVLKGFIYSMK